MGILGKDNPTFNVVSDTAPINPRDGQKWTNSSTGKDYTWYEDGSSGQWINSVDRVENVPVQSLGGVVGYEKDESFAVQSSSIIIPWDDTIPQITEGTQIHSISYTPKYANSILVIKASANSNTGTINITTILTLFVDGNADAIKSSRFSDSTEQQEKSTQQVSLDHTYLCTSTDTLDFTLRYGITSAGTVYTNATTVGGRRLGGTTSTFLEVTELNINAISQAIPQSGEVLQTRYAYNTSEFSPVAVDDIFATLDFTPKSLNSSIIISINSHIESLVSSAGGVFAGIYVDGVLQNDSEYWFNDSGNVRGTWCFTRIYINTDITIKTIDFKCESTTNSPPKLKRGKSITVTEIQN